MNIIKEQSYVVKYRAKFDTSISYVQIIADSFEDAIKIFNAKYPDGYLRGIETGAEIIRKSTKTLQINV